MNDYFTIIDDNNNEIQMELVYTFRLDSEEKDYIIYKEVNNKFPLYAAKVNLKEGLNDLDTNFTTEEKLLISKILRERISGNF